MGEVLSCNVKIISQCQDNVVHIHMLTCETMFGARHLLCYFCPLDGKRRQAIRACMLICDAGTMDTVT